MGENGRRGERARPGRARPRLAGSAHAWERGGRRGRVGLRLWTEKEGGEQMSPSGFSYFLIPFSISYLLYVYV